MPDDRGSSFVHEITQLSDRVVFSAAIPGQGGVNHINERPQSYWIDKFSTFDFIAFDVTRPLLWGNTDVPYW